MVAVTWGDTGTRTYHAGVDRGMLYLPNLDGISWQGLTKVSVASSGSDPSENYLDGQKILNVPGNLELSGSIEAFSAPEEFAPCAGQMRLSTGLFAADQINQPFGFSYRTLIGNDVQGQNYGYKVHVIYNVTAQAVDFQHSTETDSPSPVSYSWSVTAVPLSIPGYRPTARFVFDTTKMDVSALEVILYGSVSTNPRLPTTDELISLLTS